MFPAAGPFRRYYSNRCAAYLALKQYDQALADAKKCKEIQPKWAKGYYREGEVYMAQEKYTEAAEVFWDGCNVEPANKELSNAVCCLPAPTSLVPERHHARPRPVRRPAPRGL